MGLRLSGVGSLPMVWLTEPLNSILYVSEECLACCVSIKSLNLPLISFGWEVLQFSISSRKILKPLLTQQVNIESWPWSRAIICFSFQLQGLWPCCNNDVSKWVLVLLQSLHCQHWLYPLWVISPMFIFICVCRRLLLIPMCKAPSHVGIQW